MRRQEAGFSAAARFLAQLALFKAKEFGTVYVGGTVCGVGTVHVGSYLNIKDLVKSSSASIYVYYFI